MRLTANRRLATFLLAPLVAGVMVACQEQTQAPATVTLDTPEKRLSYGIALRMGQRMQADGMALDVDAYAMGLKDAFGGGDAQLTEEEINAEMVAFQEKMESDRQAQMEQAASANQAEGAAYLAENATREGVSVTESGLQYEVLEAAEGDMPVAADSVEVHYRGTLLDGTEFDSSYSRGQTVTFGLTQVIAGWTEGLQLMPEGSKYKFFIPSDLAYGPAGAGQMIPPNATLIFEVELVSIVKAEAPEEEAGEG